MFQRKRNSPQYGKSKPALINGTSMPKCIEEDIMVAKTTENPQREELKQKLIKLGYARYDLIEGRGQFSVRGGIVDMYHYLFDTLDCLEGSLDEVLTALYQNLHADIIRNETSLY